MDNQCPRDKLLEMIEEGSVSADNAVLMCVKYMSADDVEDMLDANQLSERFLEDEDEAPSESIVINMKTAEGKLVTREIDISNFARHEDETSVIETDPEQQIIMVQNWIKTRGNAQHNTVLQLINWYTKTYN